MAKLTTDTLKSTSISNSQSSVKPDMLSEYAKCTQAIPACIAKVIVLKGLQESKTAE